MILQPCLSCSLGSHIVESGPSSLGGPGPAQPPLPAAAARKAAGLGPDDPATEEPVAGIGKLRELHEVVFAQVVFEKGIRNRYREYKGNV